MLAEELKELGCDDAEMNEWGYVFATIPGNRAGPTIRPQERLPTIGLIAHVDTYFGTSGKDVKPQIIESYEGGDIRLNDPSRSSRRTTIPTSRSVVGHTVIHTDGVPPSSAPTTRRELRRS